MVWKWRNYEGVIAKLVPKEMIKGLIKQDIVVRPGEEVVIIRNGKIEDSITQTRLEKIGGGLSNWIQKKFGFGEDLELLFIDTKETDLEIAINEASSDYDNVKGLCTLRIKINSSNASNLLGLIRALPQSEEDAEKAFTEPLAKKLWKKKKKLFGFGKSEDWYSGMILLKSDLENKIEKEMKSKIFESLIGKYPSSEIKGNPEIRENMERLISLELRKTLDMWGLNLINFYTTLESEAFDGLESHRREVNLAIEYADIDSLPEFQEQMRNFDRDHLLEKTNREKAFELRRMGILNDEDIKDIQQEKNLGRQTKILEFKHKERLDSLDVEWKEHIQDMKEMFGEHYVSKYGVPGVLDIKDKIEQWKRARKELEVDLKIKEFQGTELEKEKVHADVEKEKARMDAEKAKYNHDTYERGMDKERQRVNDMMDRSAKMMQAAKQDLPRTFVQGGQSTPVVHVKDTSSDDKKSSKLCNGCGKPIQNGWNACPFCGVSLNK